MNKSTSVHYGYSWQSIEKTPGTVVRLHADECSKRVVTLKLYLLGTFAFISDFFLDDDKFGQRNFESPRQNLHS